jgi:hypothetical protein
MYNHANPLDELGKTRKKSAVTYFINDPSIILAEFTVTRKTLPFQSHSLMQESVPYVVSSLQVL